MCVARIPAHTASHATVLHDPGVAVDRVMAITRLTSARPSASTLHCDARVRARRLNHAGDQHS
jgi:hypothetical protein